MNTDVDIVATRDLVLQKIGRNVVNFQKMEAMLKFVLTFANFTTPISDTESRLQQQANSDRKHPMGKLVEKAAKALHSEPPMAPPDIKEMWVSHSLNLSESGSDIREWRREMRRIVKERNLLIHHMLVPFNPSSLESCHALIIQLDEQRERILQAYEHLESLVTAIRDVHRDLAENVDEIVASIVASRASHGA